MRPGSATAQHSSAIAAWPDAALRSLRNARHELNRDIVLNPADIEAWASAGESETLELKQTTGERREAARTVCAMLNHRAGRVLFGVEPDHRVLGQHVSDHTIEEVAADLREIAPPVFPTVDRVALENSRDVLVVSVSTDQHRPYSFRGQAYRRVGNTSTALSREE